MKATSLRRIGWCLSIAGLPVLSVWYGFGLTEVEEKKHLSGDVVIYGEVAKQGTFTWSTGMTVRSLIAEAGGTTAFAQLAKVKVVIPSSRRQEGLRSKAKDWLVTVVNGTNDHVDSAWEACHLPGTIPNFRMNKSSAIKATLDLRKSSTDLVLDPGDVVIVEERLISF